MRLTDNAVRSLPAPDKGNRVTYDDAVSGFGIRVTAAGSRSFVLNYRVEGRERRITIGPFPAWSVAAAREQAQKLRRQADTGSDPLAERQRRRDADTFAELAERYVDEWAKPRKRSWQEDRRRLDKHVLPAWKHRRVEDIHRRDVAALVSGIAKDAPVEANRVLALVRKVFSFAIDQSVIEHHPCLRMAAPSPETPRDRALKTADEFKALWLVTGGGEWAEVVPAREAAALRLMLFTAARNSEVAGLPWSEIHGDEWHLPAARNKSKRDRLTPLVDEALLILRKQPKGRYVFEGGRGGAMTKKQVERALAAACEKLAEQGIEKFTPHDLRRTVETGMASIGIAQETRDRVLDHKDQSVGAKVYNQHDYKAEKRAALEAWARHVMGLIRKKGNDNVVSIRKRSGTRR